MKKTLSLVIIFSIIFNLSVFAQSDAVSFKNPVIERAVREALGVTGNITRSDLLSIKYLDVRGRSMSDISDLSKCANLEYLDLNYNQISDLKPLESLTKLKYMTLSQNRISDITPLKSLKNLEYLSLDRNRIASIDGLAGLKKLAYLDVSSNSIGSIKAVQDMANLKSLRFSGNKVQELSPVQSLKQLKVLAASENLIKNIEPLSGLANLAELSLGGNDIPDYSPVKDRYDLLASDIDYEKVGRSIAVNFEDVFSYAGLEPDFDTIGFAYNQNRMVFGAGVSENGADWKAVNRKGSRNQFYDGEKFVQVRDNIFSYSYDGMKWVDKPIATNLKNISFYKIIKVKGTYYAVGARVIPPATGVSQFVGVIASSKNGTDWSLKEFKEYRGFTSSFRDICWNGSAFVITGEDILMSADGVNWSTVYKSNDYEAVDNVIWDGKRYLAFGRDYKAGMISYTSADGRKWARKPCLNKDGTVHGMVYARDMIWDGKNYFMVTSDNLMASKDGTAWEYIYLPSYNQIALDRIITFKNEYYIIGAPNNHLVLKSMDGFDWKVIYQPPTGTIDSIVELKGVYIGKDFDGALCYSADRKKWSRVSPDSRYKFHRIANVNGKVFAYGEIMGRDGTTEDVVFSTENGADWQEGKCNVMSGTLREIIWAGNRYIAISNYGLVTSADAANWDVLNADGLEASIFDISFNGSKYVLLCNNNIVLESYDLKSFKKHELDMENYCTNIVWDGSRYYLAGYEEYPLIKDDYAHGIVNNEFYDDLDRIKIYSSTDLDNWSGKSLGFYSRPEQILYADESIYIISYSAVFRSRDGYNWQREYYDVLLHNMKNTL